MRALELLNYLGAIDDDGQMTEVRGRAHGPLQAHAFCSVAWHLCWQVLLYAQTQSGVASWQNMQAVPQHTSVPTVVVCCVLCCLAGGAADGRVPP